MYVRLYVYMYMMCAYDTLCYSEWYSLSPRMNDLVDFWYLQGSPLWSVSESTILMQDNTMLFWWRRVFQRPLSCGAWLWGVIPNEYCRLDYRLNLSATSILWQLYPYVSMSSAPGLYRCYWHRVYYSYFTHTYEYGITPSWSSTTSPTK